jgi:quercetin dioxygenase-like cupin family protein
VPKKPKKHAAPGASATAPTWVHRDDLTPFSPAPGVTLRAVFAESAMTAWITIEPHTTLAVHDHPNEQIGVVLEGAIEITIAGERRLLGPGHAYTVPPNLPHGGVTGAAGCLLLETFAPPRADYLAMAREADRGPRTED